MKTRKNIPHLYYIKIRNKLLLNCVPFFFSYSKDSLPPHIKKVKQEKITDHMVVKKKRDRFNGMTEEEVMQRTLPDHLQPNLDIVIVSKILYSFKF